MSVRSDLYRGNTHYDFVGGRRKWFIFSSVILLISLGSMLIRGFNLSIDFEGGVAVLVSNENGASVEEVRTALEPIGLGDARIQQIDDGASLLVQTQALDSAEEAVFVMTVADVVGVDIEDTSLDSVGPTFGAQIALAAVRALIIFLIAVVGFITWRFEFKMAMTALAALFHDLIITFGVYSITGFEVTPATVIAILTILGYSLYDTVVVFDKINENEFELERATYTEIVNRSMNQVLMRSILTSLTSLIPVGALLFIGSLLLGAATLQEFALALFVGIAAGTYSSIFIASPLLAMWKETEEQWIRIRARRSPETEDLVLTPGATITTPARAAAPTFASGATPRPPKKRRKRR